MVTPVEKNRRRRSSTAGLTLIEVLCSAAIAAIIFLALFYGISQGLTMTQTERESLRATQIALSRMEGLRLELWDSSQLFNTNLVPTTFTDSFYPPGMSGGSSSTGVVYTGTMKITTGPFTGAATVPLYNTNMALVTVTVKWTDNYSGTPMTFFRTNYTYVSQWGVQNYVWAQ